MKRKLTVEEIEFTWNYLKNSGVEFVDVRTEMTDHVASALEEMLDEIPEAGFYGVFKSYMIQHKKDLIENAGKYRWSIDKKVLKAVLKNLMNWKVLTSAFLVAILLFTVDFATIMNPTQISIVFYVFLAGLAFIPMLLYRKLKLSFLSRIGVLANLPFLIVHQLILTKNFSFLHYQIIYAVLFWVLIAFSFTSICLAKEYKRKHQLA